MSEDSHEPEYYSDMEKQKETSSEVDPIIRDSINESLNKIVLITLNKELLISRNPNQFISAGIPENPEQMGEVVNPIIKFEVPAKQDDKELPNQYLLKALCARTETGLKLTSTSLFSINRQTDKETLVLVSFNEPTGASVRMASDIDPGLVAMDLLDKVLQMENSANNKNDS